MEEIDLERLFIIIWNKKVQIIFIILIFIAIGFVYTIKFTKPMYSSSTTLVLASSEKENSKSNVTATATDLTVNSKLVSTYGKLIKSKNVLEQVKANLDIETTEEALMNCVTVSAVEDTELIQITVNSANPNYPAPIANEVAKVFIEKVKEIYNIDNVQIVDEAQVPTNPSNVNHVRDVMISAGIGIVVAIIYAIVASFLDTSIKTAEDIETAYNIPVLASIPMIKHLEGERK